MLSDKPFRSVPDDYSDADLHYIMEFQDSVLKWGFVLKSARKDRYYNRPILILSLPQDSRYQPVIILAGS